MKEYSEYKESGLFSVSKIPIDWFVLRLKNVGNLYGGLSGKKGDDFGKENSLFNKFYVPFTNIANNDVINPNQLETVEIFENEKQNEVQSGDLLFLMSSENFDDIGKTALVKILPKNTFLNSFCKGFRIDNDIVDSRFLNYLLQADEFRKSLSKEAKGFTRINLQVGKITNLGICVPNTFAEQTSITNFLDHQTSIIDTIISKKEKLIELLKEKRQAVINEAVTKGLDSTAKMKDSGVEWLGEIPEGWEVVKLKKIANAYGRIGYRGYTTEDIVENGKGAITISPSNMKGDFMTFENCTYLNWNKYEESPEIKIFNKDILMVKTGSTYGKIGLVKDLSEKATINPQLLVLKDIKINSEYLFNLMRTPFIQYQVETNVVGSTIPTISQTKILNFQLPIPPLDQVDKIVEYMNQSMNNIDLTVQMVFSQIEKLKEYRQSLISEAVTGKIDVRDWETKQKN